MSSLGRAESEFAHQSPTSSTTSTTAAAPDLPAPGTPAEPLTGAPGQDIQDRLASRLSDLTMLRELGGRLTGAADLEDALHELLESGGSLLGARRGMVVIAGRPPDPTATPSASATAAAARAPANRRVAQHASGRAERAAAAESAPVLGTSVRRTVSAEPEPEDCSPARFGTVDSPGTAVGWGLDRSALGALETVPLDGGPYTGLVTGAGEALHADLTAEPDRAAEAETAAAAGAEEDREPPAALSPGPRYREVARQLGIGASYALPLAVPGEPPFGAVVWFHDQPAVPAPRLRALARDYCAEAAGQLVRELERQRLRRTAAALRAGLLPDRLPEVPRLRLAARCLPAGLDLAVGSDWYDAIELPDGTVGLSVGSVSGGGPADRADPSGPALGLGGAGAAAAMGRLRAALRAYAVLEGEDPVSVLGDLELLLKTTEPARTATALYAVVDPATRRLTLAGAGQCPPLLVTNYGASFVETSLSAPLGMLSCWEAPSVELRADRGDLLVLYTEGLARRSGGSLHTGEARLRAAAADAPYEVRQDPERFCAHLLSRCLEGTGAAPCSDDMVLLVARFT